MSGPQLVSELGPTFALVEGSIIIGRPDAASGWAPAIDLTNIDPGHRSSRRHAEIRVDGRTVTLRDLGSANKTFVNGHPLEPNVDHTLSEGDLVTFGGEARLRLQGRPPLSAQMHCPECHAPTKPDMTTCVACGASLTAALTMRIPPEHPCFRCSGATRGEDHCEDCVAVIASIDTQLLEICGLARSP